MNDEKQITIQSEQIADMQRNVQKLFKEKTPKEVIKLRKGAGGKMFPYVPIDYVVKKLDDKFGLFWEWIVDNSNQTDTHIIVQGRVVIKAPNGFSISRGGFGRASIKFYSGTKNPVDIGNDYKSANSDALKKAASLFGIAADVYYKELEKYEAIEENLNEDEEKKQSAMAHFFGIAGDRGFDGEHAKARIKEIYKVKHMENLSVAQIEKTTKDIENYYQVVEAGEAPLLIGKVRVPESIQTTETSVPSVVEPEALTEMKESLTEEDAEYEDGKYHCMGPKHPNDQRPETSLENPWCSQECEDAYFGGPKKAIETKPWEKKPEVGPTS